MLAIQILPVFTRPFDGGVGGSVGERNNLLLCAPANCTRSEINQSVRADRTELAPTMYYVLVLLPVRQQQKKHPPNRNDVRAACFPGGKLGATLGERKVATLSLYLSFLTVVESFQAGEKCASFLRREHWDDK